jgi:CRISPR-associated protein Cmr5
MAGRIKEIEQTRAKNAYDNVQEVINACQNWDIIMEVEDQNESIEVINAYKNWDEFTKKYNIGTKHEKLKKKYKAGVKKLPILIKTNGLGQSLAFIKNRDDGWKVIYEQLTEWLQGKQLISKENKEDIDLLAKVIQMKSNEYRQLTIECISFLNWLKRFVDGLMEDVKE